MISKAQVCLGAVAGSYGVHGAVRLKSFCAEPADIAAYGPLATEAGQSFEITLDRPIKGGFSARLSGVASKEAADALRGTRLYADRARLPELTSDEFYHADLVGLDVRDTGGALLGRIKAVLNHGAGDLLEISGPHLKEPVLLPFTQEAVPTVDLAAGCVVADPPDGVFPE